MSHGDCVCCEEFATKQEDQSDEIARLRATLGAEQIAHAECRARSERLEGAARAVVESDGKIFGGHTFGPSWVKMSSAPYEALRAALADEGGGK